MISNRSLILLVPLAAYILLQIFHANPKSIYIVTFLLLLLFYASVRKLVYGGTSGEKVIDFILLPLYFTIGLGVFSSIASSWKLVQFLFVLEAIFLYLYYRLIYYFLIKIDSYQTGSLAEFSSQSNLIAFYFLATSMYGLQSFLNPPMWILLLFVMVVAGMIAYQMAMVNGIDGKRGIFYILLTCLILSELSWCLSFMTLSYYVSGLVLTVLYFVLINFIRFYLIDDLSKQLVRNYIIFGVLSILAVLLTSNWL